MTSEKSTWKRNKLLTARRNYFWGGGPMNGSMIQRAIAANNPGFAIEIPGLSEVYALPTTPTTPETRAAQQEVNLGKTTKETAGDVRKNTDTSWAIGGIASGVGFLADATTNMVNGINASGVKARQKEYDTQVNNAQMKGQAANDSFDALANDMATIAPLEKVDKYDFGAKKAGVIAVEGLTQGMKGALAGYNTGTAIEGMAGAGAGATGPGLSQGGDGQLAALMGAYGGRLGRPNKYMGGGIIGSIAGGVLGAGMSLIGNLINNHKAKKAAQEVNERIAYTTDFNDRSMMNRAENLTSSQLMGLEATYAALGGPLANWDGAIGYQFMQDYLNSKRLQAEGQDEETQALPTTSSMNVLRAFGGNLGVHGGDFTNGLTFIDEGGSHESNPYEGVPMGVDQEGTPNLVEEGETIYNDYVFSKRLKVPQAIRNKYKMRGTKNLSFAEASKKMAKESEERPNDPISQRGLEAMLSDLAMSQEMLKAERGSRQYANGGRKFSTGGSWAYNNTANTTSMAGNELFGEYLKDGKMDFGAMYADGSNYRNRLDNIASILYKRKNDANYQYNDTDRLALYDYMANVNKWNPNKNYGSIDELTYDNIIGDSLTTSDGLSFTYNSNATRKGLALDGKRGGHHYGVAGNYSAVANPPADPTVLADRNAKTRHWLMQKDEAGTPLDPVEIKDYDASKYTYLNTKNTSDDTTDYTDHYYNLKPETVADVADEGAKGKDTDPLYLGRNPYEWMRFAPAVGFGIGALTDAAGVTNRPDFSSADMVLNSTRGSITPKVGFKPIGNYLAEQDMDTEFYINQLNATAGANRRALLQNAGLNRGAGMAALLAADNNTQNQLGLFARQAAEYNREDRHKVAEFNRATNMFNSEGFLKADMANQAAAQAGRDFNLRGTIAAAEMRAAEKARTDANKSANLSGLFQTIGDIGFEAKNDNMLRRAIEAGVFGPGAQRVYRDDEIRAMEKAKKAEKNALKKAQRETAKKEKKFQKGIDKLTKDWSDSDWELFEKMGYALGGKMKKRKGLTF